ncbi:ATP-binding protein [Croceicoccus mobilis]|uniref:Transposase n=1 Tax=Croceicoccus mobilis TaxID=1703339 RepID=A0A916YQI5_9SPHN|nr:ATP-binding protein [Croceicoccus mobilis]GGD56398.1 transposase [Croceicoccus mobilis]
MTLNTNKEIDWTKHSAAVRLAVIPTVFVNRDSTTEIEAILDEIREDRRLFAEPTCMIITGETGVGKTTFLKRYRDVYGQSFRDENQNQITPVLYITLPARATPLTTAQEMVSQLVGKEFAKGGLKGLTDLAKKHLIAQKVELVICDEFQHIVRTAGSVQTYQAAEWIKEITKDTRVPFVMAGMKEVTAIVETNDQLKSITPYRVTLGSFYYKQRDEKTEFRNFLFNFDSALPFNEKSRIGSPKIADAIHSVTGGLLRPLNFLLRKAAELALHGEHEKIEVIDLYAATEQIMRRGTITGKSNPFTKLLDGGRETKNAA